MVISFCDLSSWDARERLINCFDNPMSWWCRIIFLDSEKKPTCLVGHGDLKCPNDERIIIASCQCDCQTVFLWYSDDRRVIFALPLKGKFFIKYFNRPMMRASCVVMTRALLKGIFILIMLIRIIWIVIIWHHGDDVAFIKSIFIWAVVRRQTGDRRVAWSNMSNDS